MPANDLLVLNFCPGEHKDDIVIEAHRYFVFGGSYDWYWLYDSTGKKELGPLGHFDNPDAAGGAGAQRMVQGISGRLLKRLAGYR